MSEPNMTGVAKKGKKKKATLNCKFSAQGFRFSGYLVKKEVETVDNDNDQRITASGGAVINTAVFVQNVQQLRKLLTPSMCSLLYKEWSANHPFGEAVEFVNGTLKTVPKECDGFEERLMPHKLTLVLLGLSIGLQLIYGAFQMGEAIMFRLCGAENFKHDSSEKKLTNSQRRYIIRTITAILAFIIAVLTMIIGALAE